MNQTFDYAESIQHFIDIADEDLKKIKHVFALFSSKASQETIKILAKSAIDGKKDHWRNDFLLNLMDRHGFTEQTISAGLRRMLGAGILTHRKTDGDAFYGLSPVFKACLKAIEVLYYDNQEFSYKKALRNFIKLDQEDFEAIKEAFSVLKSSSTIAILRLLGENKLNGINRLRAKDISFEMYKLYQYSNPRIQRNYTKLMIQQLVRKSKDKKYVCYSLSPLFEKLLIAIEFIIPHLDNIVNVDEK